MSKRIGKNQSKGLMSEKPTEEIFQKAKEWSSYYGWKIIGESYPLLQCEKLTFVAIPKGVTLFFDAEKHIMITAMYHEERKAYTILSRELKTLRALFNILGYPREHLDINKSEIITIKHWRKPTKIEHIAKIYKYSINKIKFKYI